MHSIVVSQVLVERMCYFWNVIFHHGSQTWRERLSLKPVFLNELWVRNVCRLESKLDVHEFLRVQISVPVLRRCERGWQSCATSVDRLPLISAIYTPRQLSNQGRGQTLVT